MVGQSALMLAVAAAAFECGSPAPVGEMPAPADRFQFVVSDIDIRGFDPGEVPTAAVPGFDLDGVDSAGDGPTCETALPDNAYMPGFRDPMAGGVDNAFFDSFYPPWGMINIDFGEHPFRVAARAIRASIWGGQYLLVFDVSGVDSLESDASVEVRTALATPVRCAGDGPCSPELDHDDLVVPRQRMVLSTQESEVAIGSITSGRLRVVLPRMLGPLVPYYAPDPAASEDVVVEAEISADGLARGMMGGTGEVSELLPRLFDPLIWQAAETVARTADVAPRSDDPLRCDRMSFGVMFEAVPVVIE